MITKIKHPYRLTKKEYIKKYSFAYFYTLPYIKDLMNKEVENIFNKYYI